MGPGGSGSGLRLLQSPLLLLEMRSRHGLRDQRTEGHIDRLARELSGPALDGN